MVPDCLMPPVDNMVRIDLRHHVGLSLGPAVDMTDCVAGGALRSCLVSGASVGHIGAPAS